MKGNTDLDNKKLVLFFTRGVSLKVWDAIGMLDREVEIYKRLLPYLEGVSFLTYGDESEYDLTTKLGNIKVLPNRWGLSARGFSMLAPLLYWKEMKAATFLKTNQIEGSWTAVIAKLLFRKRMIARCGYLWSIVSTKQNRGRLTRLRVRFLEKLAFKFADKGVVTTEALKKYVVEKHGIKEGKVAVIPNFVNTEVFRPLKDVKREKGRICFVGRLDPEKNLFALLQAIKNLENVSLSMIGNGSQRVALEEKAQEGNINVEFLGNLPNYQLPQELNRAELFVLPSLYEGHPKTILEAMACELPVIGTDVEGIREVIAHRKTGYLCGTSAEEIRRAIVEVMGDEELKAEMGRNAREFVVQNLSIEKILEKELELLRSMVEKGR